MEWHSAWTEAAAGGGSGLCGAILLELIDISGRRSCAGDSGGGCGGIFFGSTADRSWVRFGIRMCRNVAADWRQPDHRSKESAVEMVEVSRKWHQ